MIVVGLDLSLTATGMARIDRGADRVSSIAVRTVVSQPGGKSIEARYDRLRAIRSDIEDFVPHGALAVIESPAHSRQGGARHERSGLWWMVAEVAIARGCRVVEAEPTLRARYATGHGNPGKKAVVTAMQAEFPRVPIANDNEADALALASLGMRLIGFPVDATFSHRVESVAVVKGAL